MQPLLLWPNGNFGFSLQAVTCGSLWRDWPSTKCLFFNLGLKSTKAASLPRMVEMFSSPAYVEGEKERSPDSTALQVLFGNRWGFFFSPPRNVKLATSLPGLNEGNYLSWVIVASGEVLLRLCSHRRLNLGAD